MGAKFVLATAFALATTSVANAIPHHGGVDYDLLKARNHASCAAEIAIAADVVGDERAARAVRHYRDVGVGLVGQQKFAELFNETVAIDANVLTALINKNQKEFIVEVRAMAERVNDCLQTAEMYY